MIKIVIEKALVKTEADKAAFTIVRAALERALKKIEADVKKEGGSVEVKVTGPGVFGLSMEGLSPRLRKRVASVMNGLSL